MKRIIVKQDVELVIADLLIHAHAGGAEVGGTRDNGAGFVFVESFRPKNVEFGVKPFGRVRFQFNLF